MKKSLKERYRNHIEVIEPIPVVYMRRVGAYGAENYTLMQDMKVWINRNNLWHKDGVIYGIARDNAYTTPAKECRYDVCFVTDSTFEDGVINYSTLPNGKYLVFEVPHTIEDVQHFWEEIAKTTTNTEQKVAFDTPILERYKFALVEKGFCEFCIPLLT